MPAKKFIEAAPCTFQHGLGLFELLLRDQRVRKAPPNLRIAAR
jgi:hypothetical protein